MTVFTKEEGKFRSEGRIVIHKQNIHFFYFLQNLLPKLPVWYPVVINCKLTVLLERGRFLWFPAATQMNSRFIWVFLLFFYIVFSLENNNIKIKKRTKAILNPHLKGFCPINTLFFWKNRLLIFIHTSLSKNNFYTTLNYYTGVGFRPFLSFKISKRKKNACFW